MMLRKVDDEARERDREREVDDRHKCGREKIEPALAIEAAEVGRSHGSIGRFGCRLGSDGLPERDRSAADFSPDYVLTGEYPQAR